MDDKCFESALIAEDAALQPSEDSPAYEREFYEQEESEATMLENRPYLQPVYFISPALLLDHLNSPSSSSSSSTFQEQLSSGQEIPGPLSASSSFIDVTPSDPQSIPSAKKKKKRNPIAKLGKFIRTTLGISSSSKVNPDAASFQQQQPQQEDPASSSSVPQLDPENLSSSPIEDPSIVTSSASSPLNFSNPFEKVGFLYVSLKPKKGFKRRWCCLTETQLLIQRQWTDIKPKKRVAINATTLSVQQIGAIHIKPNSSSTAGQTQPIFQAEADLKCAFVLTNDDEKIAFATDSEKELEEWVEVFRLIEFKNFSTLQRGPLTLRERVEIQLADELAFLEEQGMEPSAGPTINVELLESVHGKFVNELTGQWLTLQ